MHALRLGVGEETARLLRDGFAARERAAERQRDRLALLRAERALLAQVASDAPALAVAVPAAGLFVASAPASPPAHPSAALARLRARIEAVHGAGFVAARIAALRDARARLVPQPLPALGALDLDSEPALLDTFASRQADLAAAQTAFELLRDAAPLREDALAPADPAAAPLSAAERRALCDFAGALEPELAVLAGSRRPDLGAALLLGAARLLALDQSCASGELLVLDATAGSDAMPLPAPQPDALALLQRDADLALARARRVFVGRAFDVRRLSDLEAASARSAWLRRAAGSGVLRVSDDRPVPGRAAPRTDVPRPPIARADLDVALAQAQLRQREAEQAIAALAAYDLTARNCVTELLRTANHALGDAPAEITARLGGYLDADAPGLFVPFVSASAVRAHYRVVRETEIPSLRALRVAELAAREGGLATALREVSPLTARSYAPATADSPFLFFADRAPALRPLFGVANLATGAGASLVGLASAPFDAGRRLEAGLRGMLWSLPEFAFVSVRKGTNEYVSRTWVDVAKVSLEGD
ncbi:MAG TPA: hypothetical protein VFY49_20165 [Myxococcota bacterium]|nr:hypothetical protein [Myxococcota bacterium]